MELIDELLKNKDQVIIAIDGPCGSGKTTLAADLQKEYNATVFHMDDYLLPKDKQTKSMAGMIDLVRFQEEVLVALYEKEPVVTAAFDEETQTMGAQQKYTPEKLVIIEGAFSQHPLFTSFYDLKIWIEASEETREKRLKEQGRWDAYKEVRIPAEDAYFEFYEVCDNIDVFWMGEEPKPMHEDDCDCDECHHHHHEE